MHKKIFLLIFVVVSLVAFSCRKRHVRDFSPKANFDALWQILDCKYCFFEEKGIDWDGVRRVYEAQLPEIRSQVAMFDLFAKMLDTLQDGHVNLYSPFDVSRSKGWFESYPSNFDKNIGLEVASNTLR